MSTKEIESWKGFEYALKEENGILFNKMDKIVQIAAAGNNVYVTWWERNQTMNEPVMKVSNDNGKIFREKIMLSNNALLQSR